MLRQPGRHRDILAGVVNSLPASCLGRLQRLSVPRLSQDLFIAFKSVGACLELGHRRPRPLELELERCLSLFVGRSTSVRLRPETHIIEFLSRLPYAWDRFVSIFGISRPVSSFVRPRCFICFISFWLPFLLRKSVFKSLDRYKPEQLPSSYLQMRAGGVPTGPSTLCL